MYFSGSPWSATNGERIIPISSEVVKPYIEILPKKAPLFITVSRSCSIILENPLKKKEATEAFYATNFQPLRDIAVVSGQSARFECIVQAEPQPKVEWSKDGTIVENTANSQVYYRNGVCRLTLPRTSIGQFFAYHSNINLRKN